MNYLALCQRTVLEASIAGNGPSSVSTPQSKELQRIINWVADEWLLLQGTRCWSWQWENPTLTVLAATNSVAGTIAPARYAVDATFIGSTPIIYYPWDQFRMLWPAGDVADGQPDAWSIRPDLAFVVNAKPTADTAITVERYANPTALAADDDVPGMPEDLHMYLVWAALMKYAARDEAGSLYSTAEKFANDIKAAIMERCLPQISLGGALC